jgi:hypothetical protein
VANEKGTGPPNTAPDRTARPAQTNDPTLTVLSRAADTDKASPWRVADSNWAESWKVADVNQALP